ncbi:MAG: hypothetical protein KY468_13680 [Armatimonadetes bacterium]|nr:hypothetical protein [Armatimonadota bacterium]
MKAWIVGLGVWILFMGASPVSVSSEKGTRHVSPAAFKARPQRAGTPQLAPASRQQHPKKGKQKMDEGREVPSVRWIRPSASSPLPRWGIEGGIQFALWPAAIEGKGDGGPRGLIRVGYPALDGGRRAGLVNFIAVEPEVKGQPKGYSELETSSADGRPGKPMWTSPKPGGPPDPGTISSPDPKRPEIRELKVTVRMERFANGAHPYLEVSVRSDRPGELRLRAFHEPDSAPMERCILTATMGNYARLRHLHLKGRVVDSRELFKTYEGDHFTGDAIFPLKEIPRNRGGDVVAALTTDETDPAAVQPFPNATGWGWRGETLTQ